MLPPRGMLHEEQIMSPLCAPGILQIAISMLSTPKLFACLLSRSTTVPSRLYPNQACGPLKLHTLSLTCWLQELMKFSPSHFPSQWLGETLSLYILLCASVFPTLLCDHSSLPYTAAVIYFFPKPHLCTSYLLLCGLFSLFSCRVCSVSLWVYFWGI